MKSNKHILSVLLLAFLIPSCSKIEGPEGPQGKPGTPLTGSLAGYVSVYDEFGSSVTDKSGIKVTVEGTTPEISVTTNTIGMYQIDNLPMGTYDLSYSKTGYCTSKNFGISHSGGIKPTIVYGYISQTPATKIESFSLSYADYNNIYYSINVSPSIPTGMNRYVRIFYGRTNLVTPEFYVSTTRITLSQAQTNGSLSIDRTKFGGVSKIFLVAVPESGYSVSYQNNITGWFNYFNLGSPRTEVKSVNIPY
jgi:hypothetical protein